MHELETLLKQCLGPLERYVNYKINNKQDAEDISVLFSERITGKQLLILQ